MLINDLTGDGINDFLFFDRANSYAGKFYSGSASEGFVELLDAANDLATISPAGSAGATPSSAVVVDYDRDGIKDILVSWHASSTAVANELYRWDSSTNVFQRVASSDTLAGPILADTQVRVTQVVVADFVS